MKTCSALRLGSVALALALGAAGCSSSSSHRNQPGNEPPFASAMAAPSGSVPLRVAVTLSAAGSWDPDGDVLAYHWTLARPGGSAAALSGADASVATFTPDRPGTYTATVTVRDGKGATASASAAVVAADQPPVVQLPTQLYGNVHAAITLDAAASDPEGEPLAYAWSVVSAPTGSTAAIAAPAAASSTLTPDVAGTYGLRLVVSDPVQSTTVDATVTVYAPVPPIAFRPLDVEYDRALDRVVAVSDAPPALHLYDALNGADQSVALPLSPSCVSVSPDGRMAAVGHDGYLTIVDLETRTITHTWPVTADVGDVVLTNPVTVGARTTRFAELYPQVDQWEELHAVDVDIGLEKLGSSWGVYAGGALKLRPGTSQLILMDPDTISPQQVYAYTVGADGVPVYQFESPYWGDYGMGETFWVSSDGVQILFASGYRFRASDLSYAGKTVLGPLAAADAFIPTSGTGKWIVQPATTYYGSTDAAPRDGSFYVLDAEYLANPVRTDYPKLGAGAVAYPVHGRWVFFDASGTRAIAIVQVDAEANRLNDYAVLVY